MMNMLIISGLSGSGKSVALQALEDLDYYCIDNLPLGLLPSLAEQIRDPDATRRIENIAVGIDARNLTRDLNRFGEILAAVKAMGVSCELVFLTASENVLVKRFSETRRKHPLTRANVSLIEAIAEERELLASISASADVHIDTTTYNVHELRSLIGERIAERRDSSLSLLFVSFGYKHGIPYDADFVFDIRCLPNPHWNPQLRLHRGTDPAVIEFLERQPSVGAMFADVRSFLERWIPAFEAEDRSYLCVAIGCTGGQHRSVYLAEALARHFRGSRANVMVRHRELR